MLTLHNADLRVTLLDPDDAADRHHQGTRYAWGGYIWQVDDAVAGPLLAGPEWPTAAPIPFNGQGLPESFRSHDHGSGRPLLLADGASFIPGVGEVEVGAEGELAVTEPCTWTVRRAPGEVVFSTAQAGGGHAVEITRRVALDGRALTSATRVRNVGTRVLPLHWFAHPFFALTDGLVVCDLPADWGMAENAGFALDGAGRLTQRRRFRDQHDGHFELLRVGESPLTARVAHPTVGHITVTTDFVPDLCPIWGNGNTWSVEPYVMRDLAPGDTTAWELGYRFGTPA
jgi:hypothetical protein